MEELPFEIPPSLSSYITQFLSDPDAGIAGLEAHLKKRGMDAVGFFLLSWFCYNNEKKDQAIHYAFKAKCSAPGSPFLEHLHYYLVHPDHFDAWKPHTEGNAASLNAIDQQDSSDPAGYALNLDQLIEQLSRAENKKITISSGPEADHNPEETSERVDDVVSETLAKIYEKQEKFNEAIQTLEKLRQIKPGKASYYENEIRRLRAIIDEI